MRIQPMGCGGSRRCSGGKSTARSTAKPCTASSNTTLTGVAQAARQASTGGCLAVAGDATKSTVGDRYHASLHEPGWLVSTDGDHRLLRPDDRRMAALAVGDRAGGRKRARGCAPGPRNRQHDDSRPARRLPTHHVGRDERQSRPDQAHDRRPEVADVPDHTVCCDGQV